MPSLPLSSVTELLDILPDAVLMVDGRGDIAYANPGVHRLLGHAPGDLCGQPLSVLLPPAMRERHEGVVRRFREHGVATKMGSRPMLSAVHRSGRLVPVSISVCNLDIADGERLSVAVLHDVSMLNTHLDRATELAETDTLTGVGNRLRLSRRMQALLDTGRRFALLFLDLQQFKPFNDRYGHEAGDEALRIVGHRLRAQVRDQDLVVRLGGDEFVLLLDDMDDAAHLRQRALAIQASLVQPVRVADVPCVLGVNIGGAIRSLHGQTERDLLAAADRAMYLAKQAGEPFRLAGVPVPGKAA